MWVIRTASLLCAFAIKLPKNCFNCQATRATTGFSGHLCLEYIAKFKHATVIICVLLRIISTFIGDEARKSFYLQATIASAL